MAVARVDETFARGWGEGGEQGPPPGKSPLSCHGSPGSSWCTTNCPCPRFAWSMSSGCLPLSALSSASILRVCCTMTFTSSATVPKTSCMGSSCATRTHQMLAPLHKQRALIICTTAAPLPEHPVPCCHGRGRTGMEPAHRSWNASAASRPFCLCTVECIWIFLFATASIPSFVGKKTRFDASFVLSPSECSTSPHGTVFGCRAQKFSSNFFCAQVQRKCRSVCQVGDGARASAQDVGRACATVRAHT